MGHRHRAPAFIALIMSCLPQRVSGRGLKQVPLKPLIAEEEELEGWASTGWLKGVKSRPHPGQSPSVALAPRSRHEQMSEPTMKQVPNAGSGGRGRRRCPLNLGLHNEL